jgi:hypothetical protein
MGTYANVDDLGLALGPWHLHEHIAILLHMSLLWNDS